MNLYRMLTHRFREKVEPDQEVAFIKEYVGAPIPAGSDVVNRAIELDAWWTTHLTRLAELH